MNAVRKFTVLCLMLLIASLTYASSYSNDAFVLVDVSGTMKDSQANTEAKSIIQEILLGEFDYSRWQTKGWNKSNVKDIIPTDAILHRGSRFCLIPFGNMDRVQNNSKYIFQETDDFKRFYSSAYPSVFKDSWTYLTLAKAYVGAIAVNDNIKNAYVFIFTDGRPESTNQPYNNYDLHLVDELEHAGSNGFKKIGILRKNSNNFHYDVEIWEFTSYSPGGVLEVTASDMQYTGTEVETKVIVKCETKTLSLNTDYRIISGNRGTNKGQYTVEVEGIGEYTGRRSSKVWNITDKTTPPQSIRITAPTDGRLNDNPHKVDKGQELTLRWSGGTGSVNVYTKNGNSYKLIAPNKRNEYYAQTISGTTAKLTFTESADYKIEVRGTNGGSDSMFLSVTTPILPILLKLLLIICLFVGGVYAYSKYFRHRQSPVPSDDNGLEGTNRTNLNTSHASSGNDDW